MSIPNWTPDGYKQVPEEEEGRCTGCAFWEEDIEINFCHHTFQCKKIIFKKKEINED